LNENDEVRAITRSCGTCASWLSSSSDRPSEKYSWSLAWLMSTKGSTAMELSEELPRLLLGLRGDFAFCRSTVSAAFHGASTNLSKAKYPSAQAARR
jgi:hypothetical protein